MESRLIVLKRITPAFSDERGEIYDLLEEAVGHVGMVTFKNGTIRGNHYHIQSIQYSYILKGRIALLVSQKDGSEQEQHILEEGVYAKIPPDIIHTYTALEDAVMLDMSTLSRSDDGYERDTVRV